ncbi:MAG: diguanylate cyclase [Gammaproteobacteria bacterium]
MKVMPALGLDPTTLLFSISVLGFLTAALCIASCRTAGGERYGLVEWSKAMLAAGGAFLLYFLRGHGPELLTFVVANALVMAIPAYALLAHARFLSVKAPRQAIAASYLAGMGGVAAHYLFGASREIAIVTLASAIAVMFAMTAALILRHSGWKGSPAGWFSAVAMVVLAAVSTMRAAFALAGAGSSVELTAAAQPQVIALVAASLFVVGASVGFVLMVHDRQRREALESSRRDGLTGLYTRAAFFEQVAELETGRAEPYSLVMVDIDHFKAINDSHGHLGGDTVLRHVGSLILRSIRSADFAGRYGGEEFCVVLRGCNDQEARQIAERLVDEAGRQTVRLPSGAQVRFTLSIGYANRQMAPGRTAEPANQVLERADLALYEAKRAGRNQAVEAIDRRLAALRLTPGRNPCTS